MLSDGEKNIIISGHIVRWSIYFPHLKLYSQGAIIVRFRYAALHNNEGWLINSEVGTISGGRSL